MTEELFNDVKSVLDEEDVDCLLEIGCPEDEYVGEARTIATRLEALAGYERRTLLVDEIHSVVRDVCNQAFGPYEGEEFRRRDEVYKRVAVKLNNRINRDLGTKN